MIDHPAFVGMDTLLYQPFDEFGSENVFLITALANWDNNNSTNGILPVDSQAYFYNSNLNLEKFLTYSYDEDSGMHKPISRFLYFYTGESSEVVSQSWIEDSARWENRFRTLLERNPQRHLLSIQSQSWDEIVDDWINTNLTTYGRDSQGRDTTSLTRTWNPITMMWDSSSRSKTVWSEFTPRLFSVSYTDRISESFVSDSNKWILSTEDRNTFDSNGNITESIQFSYFGSITTGFRTQWTFNRYPAHAIKGIHLMPPDEGIIIGKGI